MKLVLVTLFDKQRSEVNYGNRLQMYAAVTVLKRLGDHEVQVVSYECNTTSIKNELKFMLFRLMKFKCGNKQHWFSYAKGKRFARFEKKHINCIYCERLEDVPPADKYVVGSDQVWNANWYSDKKITKELFLLTFAKPEQRVCMAPSFGTKEVPEKWKAMFQEQLKKFPELAVREIAGVSLIKELTGRSAELHIDPTLMLDEDEWRRIERPVKKVDVSKPYILTYFLGDTSLQMQQDIDKLKKELRCEVYQIMELTNIDIYSIDPSQFIYMIDHASVVLTDSFHACVFSFLFQKPFLVYQRQGVDVSMFSRIDTLLKKFDLLRKIRWQDMVIDERVYEHDYAKGYEILKRERDKVISYLRRNIE